MKLRILLATGLGLMVSTQSFASLDATSLIETIPFSGTVTSVCSFNQDYLSGYGNGSSTILDDGKGGILAVTGAQLAALYVTCNDPNGFVLMTTSANYNLLYSGTNSITYNFSMGPQLGYGSTGAVPTSPAANVGGVYGTLRPINFAQPSFRRFDTFLPNGYSNNIIGAFVSIAAKDVSVAGLYATTIQINLSPK